jgi:hypothetical protein
MVPKWTSFSDEAMRGQTLCVPSRHEPLKMDAPWLTIGTIVDKKEGPLSRASFVVEVASAKTAAIQLAFLANLVGSVWLAGRIK